VSLLLRRDAIGPMACENISHFFITLAVTACITLHVDVLRGENDHHKSEAAFKSLAIALRDAIVVNHGIDDIPSTKGVL
jgi:imidazoleglycerol-phosphate dehydratase